MKTNDSPSKFLPHVLLLLILCSSLQGISQPDYIFKNASLVSGTNLQVGAKYKFANVKSGVDAYLTLTTISPGVTLAQLDGASGYTETIQPTIAITPWTNGYVEMNIVFVKAGTMTPLVQPKISVTSIDIDGVQNYDGQGHDLHEFDAVDLGGGYFDFNTLGGELSIGTDGNWFTGTNIAGTDYPGRDTTAKPVMFTAVNVNISSLNIRAGINNQTADAATREASIYFKQFVYPNSMLAIHSSSRLKPKNSGKEQPSAFSVLPNIIQGSARVAFNASQDGWAILELVDYSGRVVMQQHLIVNEGNNNIPLFNLSQVSKGSYVAVLKMDGSVYNNKIIKQ